MVDQFLDLVLTRLAHRTFHITFRHLYPGILHGTIKPPRSISYKLAIPSELMKWCASTYGVIRVVMSIFLTPIEPMTPRPRTPRMALISHTLHAPQHTLLLHRTSSPINASRPRALRPHRLVDTVHLFFNGKQSYQMPHSITPLTRCEYGANRGLYVHVMMSLQLCKLM